VTKRDGDSSLMQLKEEFRTYETLRREHDAQIVQIATEAGLRIAPDQWSSLLYGDPVHKSHMQSIIDKLQTPQSFVQSVQELVIAFQVDVVFFEKKSKFFEIFFFQNFFEKSGSKNFENFEKKYHYFLKFNCNLLKLY
jgi:hypothetical protein